MSWAETTRAALEAISARRLRSVLTTLGILIGIAAVMLTVGFGQGAQDQVRDEIGKLGSNLLIVSPGSTTSASGVRGGRGSATTLTSGDAAMLADHAVAPDIVGVAPVTSSVETIIAGTTNWTTSVVGSTPSWLQVRNRTMAQGRFFTPAETSQAAEVAVVGATTASELFDGRPPVGQTVSVNGATFTVIGVLDTVGSTATADEDDTVVVPSTTFATRLASGGNAGSVGTLYLQARSAQSLSAAYQQADAALLMAHGVTTDTADFTIATQQSLVQTATSTQRTLTILLAGIAAISLLVGGLGVMNIMLVSVTERIREIGLRKALGATPGAIRRQFLTEACILGLAGGALGLGLGYLGAAVLPRLLAQPVSIAPYVAAGALLISLAIGVAAGVYPAGRAARLAPIDALRSE